MRRSTFRSYALPVVILAMLCTGCPSESDFDRAAKGSRELARDTELAVDVVIELYKADRLSLEAKDKALGKLELIAWNGKRFNDTLIALDQKYKDGNLPPDAVTLIRENFREVSKPFYELLSELNLFGLGDKIGALKGDIQAIEGVLK